jgi:hypothetical protein
MKVLVVRSASKRRRPLQDNFRTINALTLFCPNDDTDDEAELISYASDESDDEGTPKCSKKDVECALLVFLEQECGCKLLQAKNMTLSEVRTMMIIAADKLEEISTNNEKLEPYECRYLRPDSDIVKFPDFENGVRKL